jgi:hypothetical protein
LRQMAPIPVFADTLDEHGGDALHGDEIGTR